MDGDEVVVLLFGCFASGISLLVWYHSLAVVSMLGGRRGERWALVLVPLACLALIVCVAGTLADPEVRASGGYLLLFTMLGAVWLMGAKTLSAVVGLSIRDDAIERHNPAATAAACGLFLGVTLCYAGGLIGEGPTIWTSIGPSALATASWFALWLGLELSSNVSTAIAEERDPASGLRLAGYLVGSGLLLGRAVAGDWHSAEETWSDLLSQGWPAFLLAAVAAASQRWLEPTRERPFPSAGKHGWLPAALLVAAAAAWVAQLGRP